MIQKKVKSQKSPARIALPEAAASLQAGTQSVAGGKVKSEAPRFPASVLTPVANFLSARLHILEKRKKQISKEDPFKDVNRVDDNAAPDIEADEQFGHARTSAIKSEMGKGIIQIRKALTRIKIGKYGICEECGLMIDTDRLVAFPEATLCAKDARKREK